MRVAHACGLARKVHITLVLINGVGGLHWLGHAASDSEWVWTSGGRHVHVLSLQRLSVNRHWNLLVVRASRHTILQLSISGLLCAAPHATLNDKLVVTALHWHILTVLSSHHLLANCVSGQILVDELRALPGLEATGLTLSLLGSILLVQLLLNLSTNSLLEGLGLETNAWDLLSGVLASAPSGGGSVPVSVQLLTVNSSVSVIEGLVVLDWVFEVKVALGDVLTNNSPKVKFQLVKLSIKHSFSILSLPIVGGPGNSSQASSSGC